MVTDSRKTSILLIARNSLRKIWQACRNTVTSAWQYSSSTSLLLNGKGFCVSYHSRNSALSLTPIASAPYIDTSGMGPTYSMFSEVLKRWGYHDFVDSSPKTSG